MTFGQDAGISTDLVVRLGQAVLVSGDRSLAQPPLWGSGGFTVQERGVLSVTYVTVQGDLTVLGGATASLSGCTLDAWISPTTSGGGSLSLASMAVPAVVLGAAEAQLSGAGSTLRLAAVTLPEYPDLGALTGTLTGLSFRSKTIDPPSFGGPPGTFAVSSGPCAVSDGGRCVGRAGGYGPSETCAITVGGGGGVLGACGVFDTWPGQDPLILPDGSQHTGSDCPVGAVLSPGDSVGWTSDGSVQGNNGNGLPRSDYGLGGGWQICFA